MKEYSIEGLSYHNKYGKVIKEIGDVKKYSINIYNPSDIDIFPGIALEPIDNINFFALIKSNFLHIIDSYLIDEYISYGSAKKIIISLKN
jgi:hypothetical protein